MPPYDENYEKRLIEELKSGDESAFSTVYSILGGSLIRYVFKKTNDLDSARDIVHDIFTKLWDCREDLAVETSLSAYLYKQALNRCLNVFRHQKVEDIYIHSLAGFLESVTESADQGVLDAEFQAIVDAEIDSLPPKMREVIELRRLQGLSNKEIAQQMNISEHTVATHMKRAIRILRSKLKFTAVVVFLLLFFS